MNPPEEETSEGAGSKGLGGAISPETQMHLFKAFSELAMAMDGMMPRSKIPEEAKRHATAAHKEFLLMLRALIDARIECVEKGKAEEAPRLKKITVE